MATTAQTNAKIIQFIQDVEIAHQIIHGGPTSVTPTEGGLVRSLANILNQLEADVNAAADSVLAQVLGARDLAVSSAAAADSDAAAALASQQDAAASASSAADDATAAASSASAAATSATSAGASASAAATSASNAAASATSATNSATTASGAATTATTARTEAQAARTQAVEAATAATASATAAATSESEAGASATSAATSATSAATSTSNAAASASAAAGSASSASASATSAGNSATNASASEAAAATSALSASGSATAANTARGDAVAARDAAQSASTTAIGAATTATAAADSASDDAAAAASAASAASQSEANAAASAAAAAASQGLAAASEAAAADSASAAQWSASVAINAPGTSATSATALSIGSGAKVLVLDQADKAFQVGQWVYLVDTAAPEANWLHGVVSAFTPATGDMTISVVRVAGSGTISSWLVMPASPNYGVLTMLPDGSVEMNADITVHGAVIASGVDPMFVLNDTDGADFALAAGGGIFSVLVDRTSDGTHEGPVPLVLNANNNTGHLFGSTIWTAANDGPGSGLDADTVDGLQAAAFARTDGSGASGTWGISISGNAASASNSAQLGGVAATSFARLDIAQTYTGGGVRQFDMLSTQVINNSTGNQGPVQIRNASTTAGDAFMTFHLASRHAAYFGLHDFGVGNGFDLAVGGWSLGANAFRMWHDGNASLSRTYTGSLVGSASQLSGMVANNSDATANTIAARNSSGDIHARLFRSSHAAQASISGAMAFRINDSSDNYIRFCSDVAAIRTFLDVPTRSGGNASGTWGIGISGNAATATALATARTINGVSFNGTANITIADSTKLPLDGGILTGHVTLNDNVIARFGTGADFDMFCNGSNMYFDMKSTGVGSLFMRDGTTTRFTFARASGDFTASGNVTAYSDERLKKDWEDLEAWFVEGLAGVQAGTYTRKDTGKRQMGVSAQSLRKVAPAAVREDEDGMLSVAYGNVALAGTVALAREVISLRERVRALEAR